VWLSASKHSQESDCIASLGYFKEIACPCAILTNPFLNLTNYCGATFSHLDGDGDFISNIQHGLTYPR
jgi:hypothetical protein